MSERRVGQASSRHRQAPKPSLPAQLDCAAAEEQSGGPMMSFIALVFAFTYIGMALGRVPGLRIDRSGIAMIAAVMLVAAGAMPVDEIAAAIHFPTLLLIGGLMILSARVGAAGFYDAAAAWIARQAGRPLRLLALTIAIGGVLSAFLVNDIVVFAMTPCSAQGLPQGI